MIIVYRSGLSSVGASIPYWYVYVIYVHMFLSQSDQIGPPT